MAEEATGVEAVIGVGGLESPFQRVSFPPLFFGSSKRRRRKEEEEGDDFGRKMSVMRTFFRHKNT